MTTIWAILAAAGVIIALVVASWKLSYRAGQSQGSSSADADRARAEAAANKAAAEELAKPVSREDVARDLDKGEF